MTQKLRLLAYFLAAGLMTPAFAAPAKAPQQGAAQRQLSLATAERADDARVELDAELFYELLLGEMYAYRGDAATSVELLLDAARRSGDEKVYQRSAQLALLSRSATRATQVAQAWKSAFPQSRAASRYMLQVMLSTNQGEETGPLLKQEIALAKPDEKLDWIRAISSIYRRLSDQELAARIVREALTPELENPATGPESWAAIGRMELAADQKSQALASARRSLQLNPDNESAAKLAADLVNAGVPGAEALVVDFLDKSKSGEAHLAYARSLMNAERFTEAKAQLDAAGLKTRVVSIPSTDVFLRQDAAYRESVLPNAVRKRVAIEAGVTGFWRQFVGLDGAVIGIDTFGASAPADKLFKHFGITTDHVVAAAKAL